MTVAAGNWAAGQVVQLSGLTTATWLNGHTVTLLTGTTTTALVFVDPTGHGTSASHSDAGTATIDYAGYTFTIAGFTNAGNNGTFVVTSNTATTLVIANASGVDETHSATAASNTINYSPNGNFTTNATVGQLVFGTNCNSGGEQIFSVVQLAQGTISSINSATQITVSTVPSTANNAGCIIWGDDESTALTNAWDAVIACPNGAKLILPGINPQGNGAAVILVQSAQLNYNATVAPGTGANAAGWGAEGSGIEWTYIVPTPNFNTASAVQSTCFLYTPDGGNFSNFTIWGGGNGSPGSAYAPSSGHSYTVLMKAICSTWHFTDGETHLQTD